MSEAQADRSASRFRASPHTVAQRLGDEIVLVHMKTDRIFVLNRTGARLWDLVCAGRDRADIQRLMLQEFDVNDAQLASEIETLLASLRAEGLISLADGS